MTDKYRHTKGTIQDNAIAALLHDPLFRQRREKNLKGKGSYCRKGKQGKSQNWEASGKIIDGDFTTALLAYPSTILALILTAFLQNRLPVTTNEPAA